MAKQDWERRTSARLGQRFSADRLIARTHFNRATFSHLQHQQLNTWSPTTRAAPKARSGIQTNTNLGPTWVSVECQGTCAHTGAIDASQLSDEPTVDSVYVRDRTLQTK